MNKLNSSTLLFICLAILAAGCVSRPLASPLQSVSFPTVVLQPDEHIESIDLTITCGCVVTFNHFLDDWDTKITWDNPALQFVSLEERHFVSGLYDIHKLDGFITIEAGAACFGMKAILVTESTDPPGRPSRQIEIKTSEFIFEPQPQK